MNKREQFIQTMADMAVAMTSVIESNDVERQAEIVMEHAPEYWQAIFGCMMQAPVSTAEIERCKVTARADWDSMREAV